MTAKSFAYAIDRVANHDLASPGAQFITDRNGADIVGAQAVNKGAAQNVSGVTAKGRTLTIRLVKSDPAFLFILTMPFFQATPRTMPLTQEVTGSYPSAGPYFYSRNDVNVETSIRRNPFWKPGPGRMRPRNLTGVDVIWNQGVDALFAQVQAGQIDEDPVIPPDQIQGVTDRYGVNKTRFWVKPQNCTGSLLFNNTNASLPEQRPPAQGDQLGRRPDRLCSARGAVCGFTMDASAPAAVPRFDVGEEATAVRAEGEHREGEEARGRALSQRPHRRHLSRPRDIYSGQARLVRRDLIRLGFDPASIDIQPVTLESAPPADWDLAVSWGWCADIVDPYALLQPFLYGSGLT